jgi:acyl CoA:acetate/3-ketoacid CoA transferase alpha subunit
VVEVERVENEPLPAHAIDIPGIYVRRVIALADGR